jgi:hypothetical protein
LTLARTVGSWSGGTSVVYVGHVEGVIDPAVFAGPVAVYARCDKQQRIFYVRDEDLVARRPRAVLVTREGGETIED